jgi:hypothetical protein
MHIIMAFEINFESNFKIKSLLLKEISFKAYMSQIGFSKIIISKGFTPNSVFRGCQTPWFNIKILQI